MDHTAVVLVRWKVEVGLMYGSTGFEHLCSHMLLLWVMSLRPFIAMINLNGLFR